MDLDGALHERIERLCAEGDALAEQGSLPKALASYWAAFDLLPEPRLDWDAARWILAAIGDANFKGGDFVACRDNLCLAMRCPEAIGNPFLHLRLGQAQYELGDLRRAEDDLARALLGGGQDLFSDEDPKYLAFVKTVLRPPPEGWDRYRGGSSKKG